MTTHERHAIHYSNDTDYVAARLNEYDLQTAGDDEYDLPQFICDNLDDLVDAHASAEDEDGAIVLWDGTVVVYLVGRYFRGWVARR